MLSEENKKSEPFSYREKVRIFMVWCTKKNQNTFVFWFFFLSTRWKGSNRAAARSAASKATERLCLACGSQRLGMSTVEAVIEKFMAIKRKE